nr:interferon alpha-inducible protein 27-like protein 2 isoform X2 [Saimiri boliviensis boliviensis]
MDPSSGAGERGVGRAGPASCWAKGAGVSLLDGGGRNTPRRLTFPGSSWNPDGLTLLEVAAAAAVGGALAVGAVPMVLSAMGFTGAGIAASSIAANMMSAAAMANGGGISAGSLVAILQSVGAAGLSTLSNVFLVIGGSVMGACLGGRR